MTTDHALKWRHDPVTDWADRTADGRPLIVPCPYVRVADGARCVYQSEPGHAERAGHEGSHFNPKR